MNRALRRIEWKLDVLITDVRAIRLDEYEEENEEMSQLADQILAKLEQANTQQDGFLVVLNELKANQDNPAKLQQIAKSIDEQQDDWTEAFTVNTTPEEPPFDPSAN